MDAYEATRIVFSRLQALDSENAAKIMGLLLIQDDGVKDMIRLAFGPENLLHSVIMKARKDLGLFPSSTPTSPFSRFPFSRSSSFNEEDVIRSNGSIEFLSFLNEQNTPDSVYNGWEQRACLSPDGFGWKPCLYYQRGFCKNGSSCRFLHGHVDDISPSMEQELMLMRSKSQRLATLAADFPYSPIASSSNKCFNFMLQQQQNESQRAAAVALLLEGENQKFMGRARLERSDFAGIVNPSARQIYLTFPADSTFREEDVSNYFSIYGPVQDVRIPYQQKRMFGFVTFLYPETVKLILAKGNPHFVCDARVLVKPYKEKGKVPEKKQLQTERIDFSGCNSPSGMDSRDPFDLQQLANARMLYGGNYQDVLSRRKLEDQQAAAELQQAIEMQGRRFTGLQLLDIKNRSFSSSTAPILSPLTTPTSTLFNNTDGRSSNGSQDESVLLEGLLEDKSLSPASAVLSKAATTAQTAVNYVESAASEPIPNEDINYQESDEHNLPDSPFASPTKSSFVNHIFSLDDEENSLSNNGSSIGNSNGHLISSTLLAPTSPLENMASSYKSCFFQMPRFSSGHGAVGL